MGSEACVRLLVEAGADWSIRNKKGRTALDCARQCAVCYNDEQRGYKSIQAILITEEYDFPVIHLSQIDRQSWLRRHGRLEARK